MKKVIFLNITEAQALYQGFILMLVIKVTFSELWCKNIRAVTKRPPGNNLTALQAVIFGGKFARLLKICDMKCLVPLS
ncbi:hypothetical protein INT82_10540 [Mannheimia haemolytica]|nr:hypothetical protein [Mannheimia haemolytica]